MIIKQLWSHVVYEVWTFRYLVTTQYFRYFQVFYLLMEKLHEVLTVSTVTPVLNSTNQSYQK